MSSLTRSSDSSLPIQRSSSPHWTVWEKAHSAKCTKGKRPAREGGTGEDMCAQRILLVLHPHPLRLSILVYIFLSLTWPSIFSSSPPPSCRLGAEELTARQSRLLPLSSSTWKRQRMRLRTFNRRCQSWPRLVNHASLLPVRAYMCMLCVRVSVCARVCTGNDAGAVDVGQVLAPCDDHRRAL